MKDIKIWFVVTVIVSLVVGAFGGMCGAFFLEPRLEKSAWGQRFLGNSIMETLAGGNVIEVTEDSATVDVAKKVSPAVVSIVATKEVAQNYYNLTGPDIFSFFGNPAQAAPQDSGKKEKQKVSSGSGFVVSSDGLILTNRHVVEDETADYTVYFNDGKEYPAKVLGRDAIYDIAMLKVDAKDLPVVEMADSDKLEIGQTVIAIGNALGEYQNSVTRGVISGRDRKIVAGDSRGNSEVIDEALQTDAAVNPGNSGGPLLNLAGQVVGINTAVNAGGQSLGFAIPINQAKPVVQSVKEFGRIVRPWIGVRYTMLNAEAATEYKTAKDQGAYIIPAQKGMDSSVVKDSPAEKAGLKEGDLILEVNGNKLDSEHPLVNEIIKFKPGDDIALKVFSGDKEKMVGLKLEERK